MIIDTAIESLSKLLNQPRPRLLKLLEKARAYDWLARTQPWSNGRPAPVLAAGEAGDSRAAGEGADSRAGPPGDRRAS